LNMCALGTYECMLSICNECVVHVFDMKFRRRKRRKICAPSSHELF